MEQFKTLTDVRDYIKQLECSEGQVLARPVPAGANPVFYRSCDVAKGTELVFGIQVRDFCFSNCRRWVLPHNQMGLSFSANWQHLKSIYKLKASKNPGKTVDVYWVLEKADIPPGFKFVPDQKDSRHYLLTVTEKMPVETLIKKLEWVADRLSIIRDASRAL